MKTLEEIIRKIKSVRQASQSDYVCELNGELIIHQQPELMNIWQDGKLVQRATILGRVCDYILSNELTQGEAYTKMMIEKTGFTFKYAK